MHATVVCRKRVHCCAVSWSIFVLGVITNNDRVWGRRKSAVVGDRLWSRVRHRTQLILIAHVVMLMHVAVNACKRGDISIPALLGVPFFL